MLTEQALNSGVSVMKSYASLVKAFVRVVSGKAKVINTVPAGDLSDIFVSTVTFPLLDSTIASSPSIKLNFLASALLISNISLGTNRSKPEACEVWVPV